MQRHGLRVTDLFVVALGSVEVGHLTFPLLPESSDTVTMKIVQTLSALAAVTAITTGIFTARGQEVLPREEAMKYAFAAALSEPASTQAPIKVDSDLKRPFAGHDGDYGALALPETKLTAATLQGIGKDIIPIGQLWLRKLTPMLNGSAIESSSLQMVTVSLGGESARVPMLLLGAKKTDSGSLELLVYGNGKEPLLRLPLSKAARAQSLPIEISGERDGDGGLLRLHIAGQYVATLPVTELPE